MGLELVTAEGIRIAPRIVVDKIWHAGCDDLRGKRISAGEFNYEVHHG